MYIDVNGHKTYAYTGGKDFNPAQRTVVLIHGVLCDHSVWALQSRYLAHHGWNVLAIDLPGHARSQGPAAASVQVAADQIHAMLDAAGARLVVLDAAEVRAQLDASRADERLTEQRAQRAAELFSKNFISQQALEDAIDVEFLVLRILHAERDVLEVAEQRHVAGFLRGGHVSISSPP